MHPNPPRYRALASLQQDATRQLLLFAFAGGAVAALLRPAFLGWCGLTATLALYVLVAGLLFLGLPSHLPHRRFGLANAVTLARATAMALLVGVLAEAALAAAPLSAGLRWGIVAAASAALLLDGVDGWAARRSGLASPFGARFDMEVDALFVMILAWAAYASNQAGGWVLISGLMRYMFVMAGWCWPALAAPVPPRRWRQTICVLQILALIVALAPPVGPAAASALCAVGLGLLAGSFGADCVWLFARRRAEKRIGSGSCRMT